MRDSFAMRHGHRRARALLAQGVARAVGRTSRLAGLGGGSTVGGRIGLLLDPRLLESLAEQRPIALVSGTNGKTTTTRFLAEALGGPRHVATSGAGSNLPAGLVAALAASPRGQTGVLEVDERHLPSVIDAVQPEVVVLLNLSRDQLDRVGEVRMTAERWRRALDGSDVTVVANADDPLVVYAAGRSPRVRFVSAGATWRGDANHCPVCGSGIEFNDASDRIFANASTSPSWSCRSCGFTRPPLSAWLADDRLETEIGTSHHFELAVPGAFNRGNAAAAAVAAEVLGTPLAEALAAASAVSEVAGRFSTVSVGDVRVRLLLAKNPAGFDEMLALVAPGERPLVVAINAQIADGHDPSWLWDVAFERLGGHFVVASGERWRDLAVRLEHAGVRHAGEPDQLQAIRRAGGRDIDYVGNYTSFQELRRRVAHRVRPRSAPPLTSPAADPSDRAPRNSPRTAISALRVVIVHPDLLGTYGDSGNGLVLANRARWRGVNVELVSSRSEQALPESADLYVLGGGEDGPQARAVELLSSGGLGRAVDAGAVVLAVCAGYQILGASFPGADGTVRGGLGLIDCDTVRGTPRAVGEILVSPAESISTGVGELSGVLGDLTGFENHAGRTTLGQGVSPLGRVRRGIGNGDGSDGAISGRVFGTYLHGPVLARNPQFADLLLSLVLGNELEPLEDGEERALYAERIAAAGRAKR